MFVMSGTKIRKYLYVVELFARSLTHFETKMEERQVKPIHKFFSSMDDIIVVNVVILEESLLQGIEEDAMHSVHIFLIRITCLRQES